MTSCFRKIHVLQVLSFALITINAISAIYEEGFSSGTDTGWTGGTTWTVSSGTYHQTSNYGFKNSYYTGSTGGEAFEMEADVKLLGNGDRAGIIFRKQDGSDTYYTLRIRGTGMQFWKYVNGSGTELRSWNWFSHTVGTYYTLKVKAIGSTYEFYRNGSYVDSETNTAITGDGFAGLYCNVTAADFDNVIFSSPGTGQVYIEQFNDGLAENWSAPTSWSVYNNQYVQSSTSGFQNAYLTLGEYGDGLELEARVKLTGSGDRAGIIFRKQSGSDTYYALRIRGTGMQFWKYINGSGTELRAWNWFSHTVGTFYTLKVRITGNTYEFYHNGSYVDFDTDTSITGDGQVGLYCNVTAADFDDVILVYPQNTRVAGVGYTPTYAKPAYNQNTDIPANALDASAYATIGDWLNAMNTQGKPGKIGSGTYTVGNGPANRFPLTQSIYGYGPTRPVFSGPGDTEGGFLYLKASDITIQYVRFQNFAMPLAYHSNWSFLTNYYSSTQFNWGFLCYTGYGGWSAHYYDSDLSNLSILDCEFVDCNVGMIMITNEDYRLSNFHVARNYVTGGSGFISYIGNKFDHVYIYQNYIEDMDQRETGKYGKTVGTIIWLGTDSSANHANNPEVHVENNECYNVVSSFEKDPQNSSVFADVRCCDRATISWNIMKDLVSLNGHVDANAVYSKAYNLTVEGNYFENCGSDVLIADPNSYKSGSEGGCLALKGVGDNTLVIDNTFVAGDRTMVPMVLLSQMDVTMTGCTFKDWQHTGSFDRRWGMIRTFSQSSSPKTTISDLTVINCGEGDSNLAFLFDNNGDGESDIVDLNVDFDSNRTSIIRMKYNNGNNNIINSFNLASPAQPLQRIWP